MDKLSVSEKFKFARQPIPLDSIKSDRFPLIVRIHSCDVNGSEVKSKEILRINHDGFERRVLAVDSMKRVWSFPVHTGAKFDIIGKHLESRKSVYMREIVENAERGIGKRGKRIRFSQIDTSEIRISGQEPTEDSSGLLGSDFKIKEVNRIRYFAANRVVDDEIDPKVIVLPANLEIYVTVATGLIGLPTSAMTSYMDQLTCDIKSWVNFDMCRGSSDILFYDVPPKSLGNSRTLQEDLAKLHISPMIVRVSCNSFARQRNRLRPKQTTSVHDPPKSGNMSDACADISGSKMASMMASSRGRSFRSGGSENQNALEWLRNAKISDMSTSNLVSGEEDLSEEERQARLRHRMRLLRSLDDYGYGSEHDQTGSYNGDGDKNGMKNDSIEDQTHDDISETFKSGIDVQSVGEARCASSSSTQINVPIVVEETDGSTRVVRREKPKRKATPRRYGGIFNSSPVFSTPPSTTSTNNDFSDGVNMPMLGQSQRTPFGFSEANYISVAKKWASGDGSDDGAGDGGKSDHSTTSHFVSKKTVTKFFTLSSSSAGMGREDEDDHRRNRRKSGPPGVAVDKLGTSSLTRFRSSQGF